MFSVSPEPEKDVVAVTDSFPCTLWLLSVGLSDMEVTVAAGFEFSTGGRSCRTRLALRFFSELVRSYSRTAIERCPVVSQTIFSSRFSYRRVAAVARSE